MQSVIYHFFAFHTGTVAENLLNAKKSLEDEIGYVDCNILYTRAFVKNGAPGEIRTHDFCLWRGGTLSN